MQDRNIRGQFVRAAWVGIVVILVLGHGSASLAGAPHDDGARAMVRFEPLPTPPSVLAGHLNDAASPVHVASSPQGTLYATTDKAGKARVWLLRNNAIVA